MIDWKNQIKDFLKDSNDLKRINKEKYQNEVIYPALKEIGSYLNEIGLNCTFNGPDEFSIKDRDDHLMFNYRLYLDIWSNEIKVKQKYSSKEFLNEFNLPDIGFREINGVVVEVIREDILRNKFGDAFTDKEEDLNIIPAFEKVFEIFTEKFLENAFKYQNN